MIVLYLSLFLILNFTIYKTVRSLKTVVLKVILIIALIFILKFLRENVENANVHSLIILSGFSIAIPFFTFCLMEVANYRKKTTKIRPKINNYLELKIDNYITGNNNYALHFTILITLYEFCMLLSGMYIELK